MIEQYSFGSIKIDGKDYTHDVIIAGAAVKSWWRVTSHQVSIKDLEPILAESPRFIIFGTGAMGVMQVLPEAEAFLQKQGIRFSIDKTGEAVKEFNSRSKEEGIVAAFHLTC